MAANAVAAVQRSLIFEAFLWKPAFMRIYFCCVVRSGNDFSASFSCFQCGVTSLLLVAAFILCLNSYWYDDGAHVAAADHTVSSFLCVHDLFALLLLSPDFVLRNLFLSEVVVSLHSCNCLASSVVSSSPSEFGSMLFSMRHALCVLESLWHMYILREDAASSGVCFNVPL